MSYQSYALHAFGACMPGCVWCALEAERTSALIGSMISQLAIRGALELPNDPFTAVQNIQLQKMPTRQRKKADMNNLFDVLRRLLDSRPMHEEEQQAAHVIITEAEQTINHALDAAGLNVPAGVQLGATAPAATGTTGETPADDTAKE